MQQERRIHLLECLERLKKNKNKINHCVIPDDHLCAHLSSEAPLLPASEHLSPDMLLERLRVLNGFTTKLSDSPKKSSGLGLFHLKPKVKWIAIPKEVIGLLYDLYQGKMNDYLQEILNKAEIEVTMAEPVSADSEKELDIKIKLAATFIDKYSNLLQLVIGQKTEQIREKDSQIIDNAYKALDLTTSKLRRINLIRGIKGFEKQLNNYIADTKASCLYWLFGGAKTSETLVKILDALTDEALSDRELIGALFSLQQQLNRIPDATEKRVIKKALDELMITNNLDLEGINPLIFINEFTNRADLLRIHWYKPFSFIRINMPLVCP